MRSETRSLRSARPRRARSGHRRGAGSSRLRAARRWPAQIDRYRRAGSRSWTLSRKSRTRPAQVAGAKIAALDDLKPALVRDWAMRPASFTAVGSARTRRRPARSRASRSCAAATTPHRERRHQDEGGKNDNTFQELDGAPRICPALRDDCDEKVRTVEGP